MTGNWSVAVQEDMLPGPGRAIGELSEALELGGRQSLQLLQDR